MTQWSLRKKPKSTNLLNFKTEDGQPETFIGETDGGIHLSLTELAQFFEPGDVVFTPEGPYVVHQRQGEYNN